MSESAVILEGEVARRFNPVNKLRATNQDSSVSDWVPSDTLDLGSLMASENTLYLANIDDDCDAYEEVEVDVSEELEDGDYKKITGKGSDGNDYAVGLDENGNLTSEMVPSAIHIVIKPRKLEYEEGETLDFTGIHVYLMDGNNHLFTSEDYPTGEIPFEELMFPVTVVEGSGEEGTIRTDGEGINVIELHGFIEEDPNNPDRIWVSYGTIGGKHIITTNPVIGAILYFTRYGASIYSATNKDNLGTLSIRYDGGSMATVAPASLNNLVRTYAATEQFSFVPESTSDPENINPESLPSESGTDIPVQWIRSDGEILEDNFSITIQSDSQI